MRIIRFGLLSIVVNTVVTATILLNGTAWAQQQAPSAAAPVPAALYTAKTVFISNAGADSGLFPEPFSGNPDRAYREFYANVQGLDRYDLVANPADADLVFELQLTAPNGPANANKVKGASDPLPMFRLVIYDRTSHYILWTLTQTIQVAVLQKTHDRNFDTALEMLIENLNKLTTPVATGTP